MSEPFEWDNDTRVGAAALRRMRDAKVGADRRNRGKYAVYFFDDDGAEFRSVGRFESVAQAAEAVHFIVAETLLEEVARHASDAAAHFDARGVQGAGEYR